MTSEANFEVFPIQNTITVAKKQSRFGFSIFFIFSFPFGIPFHIRMCVRLWHSILISWFLCFFELYLKIIMNWWLYISVYREMLLSCMNSVVTQSTQLLLCLIDIMLMVYRVCIPFSNEKKLFVACEYNQMLFCSWLLHESVYSISCMKLHSSNICGVFPNNLLFNNESVHRCTKSIYRMWVPYSFALWSLQFLLLLE